MCAGPDHDGRLYKHDYDRTKYLQQVSLFILYHLGVRSRVLLSVVYDSSESPAHSSSLYCIRLSASTQKLLEWRLDGSSESPAHSSDRPPRTKLRVLLMLCGVITHYIQVQADEINPTKDFRPQSSKLVQKWFIFAVDVGVIFEDRAHCLNGRQKNELSHC